MKERLYDTLNRLAERKGFGERRDRLGGLLEGRHPLLTIEASIALGQLTLRTT